MIAEAILLAMRLFHSKSLGSTIAESTLTFKWAANYWRVLLKLTLQPLKLQLYKVQSNMKSSVEKFTYCRSYTGCHESCVLLPFFTSCSILLKINVYILLIYISISNLELKSWIFFVSFYLYNIVNYRITTNICHKKIYYPKRILFRTPKGQWWPCSRRWPWWWCSCPSCCRTHSPPPSQALCRRRGCRSRQNNTMDNNVEINRMERTIVQIYNLTLKIPEKEVM